MKPPRVDAEGVDPEPHSGLAAEDPHERAAAAAALGLAEAQQPDNATVGHRAEDRLIELCRADTSPLVRAATLAALARLDPHSSRVRSAWRRAASDVDPGVRRRAAEVAPAVVADDTATARIVVAMLGDPEVAEVAAWALGEVGAAAIAAGAVAHLSSIVLDNDRENDREKSDPLVRESAVAALGTLGDPEGLDAILAGCRDRPAVRRRAVLALAPFEGPAVDAALEVALTDRDWQVRQAAEDLGAG